MPWQSLEAIARAVTVGAADAGRAQRLLQGLSQVAPQERDEALAAVASALASADPAGQLLRELAGLSDRAARQLALELAARWPGPVNTALVPSLRPLLGERGLPVGIQLAAVVALLQAVGKAGQPAVSVVRSFVTGLDKTQVRERLDALELRVGNVPALEEMRARLDAKLSAHCPRCGQKRQRDELASHLWQEHGLILDGAMVREPWSVVDDWLADAAARNDADLLARCFELAQFADPQRGLVRLERLLAEYGLDANGSPFRPTADSTTVSRCPRCAGAVAMPPELPLLRLNVSHGRLSHGGYLIELSEAGLIPRLQLETPEEVLFRATEPGRWLTRRGACFLLAGAPVLAAWVVVLVLGALGRPADLPVALLLGAGLVILLLVQAYYQLSEPVRDRALDHAWTLLAPRLHATEFSLADSAFLAGLAASSVGQGNPARRERPLERIIQVTERALAGRPEIVNQLASLWQLTADDSTRLGRDPVQVLARLLNRTLDGSLPLAFADRLLGHLYPPPEGEGHLHPPPEGEGHLHPPPEGEGHLHPPPEGEGTGGGGLSPGARARLRVLVCQQAFENGAGSADLVEAGRLAPALGTLLGKAESLAQLQLLWTQRTALPWEGCGEAFTVFELAGPGGMAAASLEQFADLLLYQFLPGQEAVSGQSAILVVSRGIVFGDVLFTKKPARIELKQAGAGYQLSIGASRFSFGQHPGNLARRLERWFYFFFDDFLPKTPAVLARSPAGLVRKLRFPEALSCPKCRQVFLPRVGETGLSLG